MVATRTPEWLYEQIAADAGYQCGYCRAPQRVIPYRLEVEHLTPVSLGGTDDRDNLWLSCHRCNKLRSNRLTVVDPLTDRQVAVFNPRRDRWGEHFVWERKGLLIVGRTAMGRGMVALLNLNDSYHLSARGVWILARAYPPSDP